MAEKSIGSFSLATWNSQKRSMSQFELNLPFGLFGVCYFAVRPLIPCLEYPAQAHPSSASAEATNTRFFLVGCCLVCLIACLLIGWMLGCFLACLFACLLASLLARLLGWLAPSQTRSLRLTPGSAWAPRPATAAWRWSMTAARRFSASVFVFFVDTTWHMFRAMFDVGRAALGVVYAFLVCLFRFPGPFCFVGL